MNRNYVYAFPSANGTCNVISYSGNRCVIDFLTCFDIWGSKGQMKVHKGYNPYPRGFDTYDFWFECSNEFFEMLHTDTMKRAFKHMGVELVFKYPFMEEFEK